MEPLSASYPNTLSIETNKDSESADNFQRFQILENVSEKHHYFSTDAVETDTKYLKAVKKEISILQHSLPQGIFVKAFESRFDLFSAMIQGPENTPYEGGLFFFDIQLPSDYPQSPPKFFYHSYNDPKENCRINPNLYSQGCVCLSILDTFDRGPRWDPRNSSLLQVLVSIQGLILVKEPFWNEPNRMVKKEENRGLEVLGIHFYTKRSEKTNREVLMLVFKSLFNILDNPSAHFRTEIRQHFKSNFDTITKKLYLWMNNCYSEVRNKDEINNMEDLLVLKYPISFPDNKFIRELNGLLEQLESKINEKIRKRNVLDVASCVSSNDSSLSLSMNDFGEQEIEQKDVTELKSVANSGNDSLVKEDVGECHFDKNEDAKVMVVAEQKNGIQHDQISNLSRSRENGVEFQTKGTETSITIENENEEPETFQGYDYDISGGPPQGAEAFKIMFYGVRFYSVTTLTGALMILIAFMIGNLFMALIASVFCLLTHLWITTALDFSARRNFSGSIVTFDLKEVSVLFGNPAIRFQRIKLRFVLMTLSFIANVLFIVSLLHFVYLAVH